MHCNDGIIYDIGYIRLLIPMKGKIGAGGKYQDKDRQCLQQERYRDC